jgi:hypothetical protein
VTDYLSSEATWRGQFSLPGQSGQGEQQGILTYKPDSGVNLSLLYGFDDPSGVTRVAPGAFAFGEGSGRFPVIHGVAGGKPVTLLDCLITRSKRVMFSPEAKEQEIHVGQLLIGVLLDAPEAKAFSGLTIELENLTVWDRREDVMLRTERHPDLPGGSRWSVEVDQAEPAHGDGGRPDDRAAAALCRAVRRCPTSRHRHLHFHCLVLQDGTCQPE